MKKLLILCLLLVLCACSQKPRTDAADNLKATAALSVTSDDLHDGVWDESITNTKYGYNLTPQLSFDELPDVTYAVYMLDESAQNWLHLYAYGLTQTDIAHGEVFENGNYIGPYPPSGTHDYTVYVFALKGEPDNGYPQNFDAPFMTAEELYKNNLDISGGQSGNVISYGFVTGTYTAH